MTSLYIVNYRMFEDDEKLYQPKIEMVRYIPVLVTLNVLGFKNTRCPYVNFIHISHLHVYNMPYNDQCKLPVLKR